MRRVLSILVAALVCAGVLAARTAASQTVLQGPLRLPAESVIGISTQDAPAEKPEGAVVTGVEAGMPAARAGFKEGDVVVEFDGERVRSSSQLSRLVRETPPNRAVKAVVMRDGRRVDLTVTPVASSARSFTFDLPSPQFREGPLQRPFTPWLDQGPLTNDRRFTLPFSPRRPIVPGLPRLGISVQDLTPQLADYFGTKEGVLVATVDDRSAAASAGLRAGDIITAIDGRHVASASDVQRALLGRKAGDQVRVDIVRERKARTVTVTLEDVRRSLEWR